MGVYVSWDNQELGVICYTVEGHWTWEEFFAARDKARELADSVPHQQIHSIIDIRAGSLFPQNALLHFRKMPAEAHPKLKAGTAVLVGDNFFVKALVDIMSRINSLAMQHFYMATSMEEAREILVLQFGQQDNSIASSA